MEVRGPQRWLIQSNWKIGAENFSGDSYHTPHTHVSVVEIGLFMEPKANRRKEGALYWAGAGGGTTYKLPTDDFDKNMAPHRLSGGDGRAHARTVGAPTKRRWWVKPGSWCPRQRSSPI